MRRYTPFLIVFLSVFILVCSSVYAGQGSAGAQFLSVYPGVHGAALGGAYTLGSGSAQVIFWNPAGIRGVTQNKVFVSHAEYLAGMNFESFAFVLPMSYGTIGIQGVGLFSGDILETTEEMPDGTGDYYSVNDISVGISYARAMTNKFTAGFTMKYIFQSIADVQARGMAIDMGAIYRTGLLGNTALAFTIRNFGFNMQYRGEGLLRFTGISDNPFEEEDVKYELVSEEYSIPLSFSLGIGSTIPLPGGQKVTLSLDAGNSIDQKETVRVGVEWKIPQLVYLGIGHGNLNRLLNPDASDEDLGGNMKMWGLGGGLNFGKFFGSDMWVEFSYEAHRYLPGIQRYGLEMSF